MHLSPDNTQLFTLFSGVKNAELLSLERLAASVHRYYDAPLYVMDQHRPMHKLIASGERIFYTTSMYVEGVSSDLDFDRLERFFQDNADFVHRIEVPEQFPHGPFINEALLNHRLLPYAVIMDSDVWFKNDRFFSDMNELVEPFAEDDLVAVGRLVQGKSFELPISHDQRYEHPLAGLGAWLIRRFGTHQRRGKLPGLEPNFFWINGALFAQLNMSFQNLQLNIFDTTIYGGQNYKLLGDNGPSVLFQASLAGKSIINVDIERWRGHAAHHVGQRTDPGERAVDWWFATDLLEWPPVNSPALPPPLSAYPLRYQVRRRIARLVRKYLMP